MKPISYFFVFFLTIYFFSCSKDIDFEIPKGEKLLVVDGLIEQGEYPYVILTEVSPFFAEYDSLELRKLVIMSAKVTINNGDTTEILSLVKNNEFFPPYVYRGFGFKGEIGKTYELKIYWKEKIHESKTELISPVNIESLSIEPFYRFYDTLGIIRANINDPINETNYYRTFTKLIGKQNNFNPFNFSVMGDNLFNGENYTFTIYQGLENLNDKETDIYFTKNDTVVVKFCSIDKESFRFWLTAEREMALSGNPLALSNNKVETNITNGAYGYWTAYSYVLDTVIVDFSGSLK